MFNDGNSEFKSIFQIGLTANPLHKLNYTIEMVSYKTSRVKGIKKGLIIGKSSIKELAGLSVLEFMDSNRYVSKIKKSPHILVFKIKLDNPWHASINKTDILKIKIC